MMTAARILRPSSEGWKLLVSALKQRWLSMAIWSWKVLPLSGSCGHKAASGLSRVGLAPRAAGAPATAPDYGPGRRVKRQVRPERSQQDPTKREHQESTS